MNKLLVASFLLLCLSCDKSSFDIDPNQTYTPSQLLKRATGKCQDKQPWEGKLVKVTGRIDQTYLSETKNGGKFWLKDERNIDFIEVYVMKATPQELAAIYQLVQRSSKVTVTGELIADQLPTQLKCRKSLHVEIAQSSAIQP